MAKKKQAPVRSFLIVGVVPGLINFKGKFYDLSQINEAVAEKLINEGCPYVKWEEEQLAEETPE